MVLKFKGDKSSQIINLDQVEFITEEYDQTYSGFKIIFNYTGGNKRSIGFRTVEEREQAMNIIEFYLEPKEIDLVKIAQEVENEKRLEKIDNAIKL